MIHIALSVMNKDYRGLTKRARQATINECGGLTFIGKPHESTAARLSKLPWVERVVATCVNETHAGTWRKGRRSV